MGYLERNSETWKTPGFSGFECRVSGIGRVSIFGFGSGSGSKKVGLFPRVSGFWVQRPITIRYLFVNVIIFIYFFLNQKSKLQILDIFTAVFHQSSARPVFGKIVARIGDG